MRRRSSNSIAQARGFTLVELIVVLAIVLALAAFAIPNLLRARETANEAAAEGALRTIATGQITYYLLYQGYAPSLKALGPPKKGALPSADAADLIDSHLANGYKSGYRFQYAMIDLNGDGIADGYEINANPEAGRGRVLSSDQSGRVYNQSLNTATDTKPGSSGGLGPQQ